MEELDTAKASITKLITVLDQRKDEAIQRTFKGVSQHFTQIFKEVVPQGKATLVMLKKKKKKAAKDDEAAEAEDDDEAPEETLVPSASRRVPARRKRRRRRAQPLAQPMMTRRRKMRTVRKRLGCWHTAAWLSVSFTGHGVCTT